MWFNVLLHALAFVSIFLIFSFISSCLLFRIIYKQLIIFRFWRKLKRKKVIKKKEERQLIGMFAISMKYGILCMYIFSFWYHCHRHRWWIETDNQQPILFLSITHKHRHTRIAKEFESLVQFEVKMNRRFGTTIVDRFGGRPQTRCGYCKNCSLRFSHGK